MVIMSEQEEKKIKMRITRFEIHPKRRARENIQATHENLLFIDDFFTELDITPALDSKCIPKTVEEAVEITPECIIDQGFVLSELQDEKLRLEETLDQYVKMRKIRQQLGKKEQIDETMKEIVSDLYKDIDDMGDAFNKAITFFKMKKDGMMRVRRTRRKTI